MDSIYDTKGTLISPHLIHNLFNKYFYLLKQYQFIQDDKKTYTIKLNLKEPFMFEEKLIQDIKKDFGKDAKIYFDYVDEIPTLASGKRRKVVNNFTKTD